MSKIDTIYIEENMFTGIIESLGIILSSQYFNEQKRFRIKPMAKWNDYKKGESIAVNGVCLTVDNFSDDWFEVYVSAESLKVTNLQKVEVSQFVNLERALMIGQRIGGHLMSGHIDTLATVKKITQKNASRIFRLEFDPKYSQYFVSKCSVALDGISLTVNQCGNGFLEVNMIPETLKVTTASKWTVGYTANMEIDLISKYLHNESKLNLEFLQNCGFAQIEGE